MYNMLGDCPTIHDVYASLDICLRAEISIINNKYIHTDNLYNFTSERFIHINTTTHQN